MVITGYPDLGVSNVPNADASQDRQLSGDVTWSKGRHNLKFGVQEYWLQTNFLSSQLSSGVFDFDGQYTKNPLADFLLGAAYSTSLSNYSYLALRAPWTNFFAQDDWKITSKLTLNIGLRYELDPPSVQKNNTISNFDLDTNPGHPVLVPAGSQGSSIADRALQNVNYNQWAPRFGLAYSLDSKTVIRAGAGTFYSNVITEGGMQSMEVNPPWNIRSVFTTNKNVAPTLVLADGFASDALSLANASNVELISYDRKGVTPTDYQWNFNIQRQLPGGILLEVGYYGNKLDHMWRQIDGNPAPPEPGNINSNRPYNSTLVPGTDDTITLANVVRIQKDGWSAYNALQAKIEKRYSNGLTFIASYAYSKTIALGDTAAVQDQQDWMADKALSSLNMTQHFVGSAVYQLPFGQGRQFGANWNRITNGFLGGWSFAPIFTVSTGHAAQHNRERQSVEYRQRRRPAQRGGQLAARQPHRGGMVQHRRLRRQRALHLRRRGPQHYSRTWISESRSGAAQIVPDYGKGQRAACASSPSTQPTRRPWALPIRCWEIALFGQITATAVGTSSRDNQIGLKVVF